jgi:hypothetical protein
MRVIGELPQSAHIDPDAARRWVEAVYQLEPERARWHALRARGIGGSEMGAVLCAMTEKYHPFTPGDKVARQKLLIDPPEEPTGDTRRGTFLEDPLRDMYRPIMLKQYGARPADDVLDAIREIDVSPDRLNPWQVGNPDDAFWLPTGELIMADYKAPRPDVLEGYKTFGKPFDYIVQLHHYTMLAIEKGFTPAKLILVSLDINKWAPAPQEISFDRDLCRQIEQAGTRFWNEFIMKGVIPEPVSRPVEEARNIPPEVMDQIRRAGRAMALGNTGYRISRRIGEMITAVSGSHFSLDAPVVKVDHLELISTPVVDENKLESQLKLWGEKLDDYRIAGALDPVLMEKRLVEMGEDLDQFRAPGEIDAHKVKERLRKARIDPLRFVRENIVVKLTPSRRGPEADSLFAVRDEAEKVTEEFVSQPDPTPEQVKEFKQRSLREWRERKNAEEAAMRGGGAADPMARIDAPSPRRRP